MDSEEIIKKAIEALGEITYEPFSTGYYVTINGEDRQGEDQCEKCIDAEVENQKNRDAEERRKIKEQFDAIRANDNTVDGKRYSDSQINKGEAYRLKKYPENAEYSYEGHDPDFGGGLTEPCSCESCGEYFQCEFNPCHQECDHLNDIVFRESPPLTDRNKWEIESALRYYCYAKDDIKPRLVKIAEQILNRPPLS